MFFGYFQVNVIFSLCVYKFTITVSPFLRSRKNANSSDLIKIEMLKMQQQRDAIEQQRNSIELQQLEFEMEKESRQKSTAGINHFITLQ